MVAHDHDRRMVFGDGYFQMIVIRLNLRRQARKTERDRQNGSALQCDLCHQTYPFYKNKNQKRMFDGGSLGFVVRCASGFVAKIFGAMLRIIAKASKPIVV